MLSPACRSGEHKMTDKIDPDKGVVIWVPDEVFSVMLVLCKK